MANIWITALAKDQAAVQLLTQHLKHYGLGVGGHFWIDDLEKFAWFDAAAEIIKQGASVWLILAAEAEMAKPSVRYGLSVLSIALNARLGHDLPVVLLGQAGAAALPTPFGSALRVDDKTPSWQAKIVALAHRQKRPSPAPYRIGMHAHEKFGQWFEVGPASGAWAGVMLGVSGASIDFHAVGKKGELPEKTVIEYGQKDMKLAIGEREYVAWACSNPVDAEHSYFVRVRGAPDSLLFGPLPQGDDADAFVLNLN